MRVRVTVCEIASRSLSAVMRIPFPGTCMKVSFGDLSLPSTIGMPVMPSQPMSPTSSRLCPLAATMEASPYSMK